jgi:transposase-like protein
MGRVPPSERIRKELGEILGGVKEGQPLLSTFFRKAAELILQEALEEEVTEFLGRGHYKRRKGEGAGRAGATAMSPWRRPLGTGF